MFFHGAGKHNFLQILTFVDEALHRIFVCDACHILLDNRTCVKLGSHIVRRCTDNLHTSLKGLVVWLCTYECWQERVMDVDDFVRIFVDHVLADDLHISGKNDEVDVVLG